MTTVRRSPVCALRIKFGRDRNGNQTVHARRAEARGTYIRRQVVNLDTHNLHPEDQAAEALALLIGMLDAEYTEAVGAAEDSPWSARPWSVAFVRDGEYVAVQSEGRRLR